MNIHFYFSYNYWEEIYVTVCQEADISKHIFWPFRLVLDKILSKLSYVFKLNVLFMSFNCKISCLSNVTVFVQLLIFYTFLFFTLGNSSLLKGNNSIIPDLLSLLSGTSLHVFIILFGVYFDIFLALVLACIVHPLFRRVLNFLWFASGITYFVSPPYQWPINWSFIWGPGILQYWANGLCLSLSIDTVV